MSGPRPIHLVGIAGAGMSGLALLAAAAGYRVSGSDRDGDSPIMGVLAGAGAVVRPEHAADGLGPEVETVFVSTAIPDENPELVEARRRGIAIRHRADLLAELMIGRRGLAVCGAHGKSTTAAMLLAALGDASACIGAPIPGGRGMGARWGAEPWFVAEADESDRSLLRLRPQAAILLNVDHDHHATFADLAAVEAVFREFVALLPADGLLVVGPDPVARRCATAAACPVRLVGPAAGEWGRAVPGDPGRGELRLAGGRSIALGLAVPGAHNLANAACALALAEWCGVDLELAAARVGRFTGVGRRFERRGAAAGVTVIDDYAHHPAEITATLAAARERAAGRVVVVFQPHLYSRTRALGHELAAALGAADLVIVTGIYAAREAPDPGVSGAHVARAVPGGAGFVADLDDVADELLPRLRPGDLVITMGAGDVTRLGGDLLSRIEQDRDVAARDPAA